MKIGFLSFTEIPFGKYPHKDIRLDEIQTAEKSQKKTYAQVELLDDSRLLQAEAIIVSRGSAADLILADLEFIETRLTNAEDAREKEFLEKLKESLEKETFVRKLDFSVEQEGFLSGYGLLTVKPVFIAEESSAQDIDGLLNRALKEFGRIAFFTAGEKEARAWLIQEGTNAWEAAGCIHSDIQKGFIRAEIVHFNDFREAQGVGRAKQAGRLHVEQKDYIIQDGDIVNIRFNK